MDKLPPEKIPLSDSAGHMRWNHLLDAANKALNAPDSRDSKRGRVCGLRLTKSNGLPSSQSNAEGNHSKQPGYHGNQGKPPGRGEGVSAHLRNMLSGSVEQLHQRNDSHERLHPATDRDHS